MKVVGHRGWPARYPENTLEGFAAALELGIDCIELDVHVTTDDHLVVFHDEDTKRVADRDVLVRESTLAELKTLDVGRKFSDAFAGARIPTLEEVVGLVDGKAQVYLEVKSPRETTDRVNAKLLPIVDRLGSDVIIHSFDADYLRVFRALRADVSTGFLCEATRETLATTREIGCSGFHPSWDSLTPDVTRAAREAGLDIYVWKVITPDDCQRVLDLEVDSVGVDCPDVMTQLLSERRLSR